MLNHAVPMAVLLIVSSCRGFVMSPSGVVARRSSCSHSCVPSLQHSARSLRANKRPSTAGKALRMFGEVVPQTAYELVKDGYSYIDVRTDSEFEHGHPKGAVNIPAFSITAMGMQRNPDFVNKVAEKYPARDSKLVVGCQMGSRSAQAAAWLEDAGYETVLNVEGGYGAWARDDNLPVEV